MELTIEKVLFRLRKKILASYKWHLLKLCDLNWQAKKFLSFYFINFSGCDLYQNVNVRLFVKKAVISVLVLTANNYIIILKNVRSNLFKFKPRFEYSGNVYFYNMHGQKDWSTCFCQTAPYQQNCVLSRLGKTYTICQTVLAPGGFQNFYIPDILNCIRTMR